MHILLSMLPYLIGLALAAVVATLMTGLFSMTRGGDFNARYGNKLMRLRIVTQATAVGLILIYALLLRLG